MKFLQHTGFRPTKIGGLGEDNVYIGLRFKQIQLLMGHIHNKDNTGNMILQELYYTQLIVGVHTPILDYDTAEIFLTWTDPSWITFIK